MPFLKFNQSWKYHLVQWCIALVFFMQATAQKSVPSEYQVKSVFLFNFTQFVEWPAESFTTPASPLVIGVYGKNPFGTFLDQTVQGEQTDGHPLIVKRFTKLDEITGCHILFICDSEKNRLKEILNYTKGKSILTVSDVNDFAKQGGMIRFLTENRKTRLRINLEAVKASNLTVSSKLLRLSEIVSIENN